MDSFAVGMHAEVHMVSSGRHHPLFELEDHPSTQNTQQTNNNSTSHKATASKGEVGWAWQMPSMAAMPKASTAFSTIGSPGARGTPPEQDRPAPRWQAPRQAKARKQKPCQRQTSVSPPWPTKARDIPKQGKPARRRQAPRTSKIIHLAYGWPWHMSSWNSQSLLGHILAFC